MEEINGIKYVYLTSENYDAQLRKPDSLWLHPGTGESCWFDDSWYETYYETYQK